MNVHQDHSLGTLQKDVFTQRLNRAIKLNLFVLEGELELCGMLENKACIDLGHMTFELPVTVNEIQEYRSLCLLMPYKILKKLQKVSSEREICLA